MDGKKVYVIGHKNPDTDSICSAICYANLKNKTDKSRTYTAKRAGEINQETKEILNIEERIPEEGISCQSASWISEQGVSKVLAGGMGGRPLMVFAQNGVEVVAGCPELPIEEVLEKYIKKVD